MDRPGLRVSRRGGRRRVVLAAAAATAALAAGGLVAPSALGSNAQAATGGSGFTISASQLLINQRIGQAAIRRLSRVAAVMDGRPVPAAGGGSAHRARVSLSARQLLINQRIFQTAVRRAAGLGASFDDRPMPAFGSGTGGTVRLTVGQLIVNQRIAQAAVRRADALASRLDEGERPVPRATPEPIPSALPAGGRIRFCGPITGDLGQAMQAWTILLTDGEFLGCDAATTILTDYYRQRPSDTPGSPPLVVDGATCNQYPKPDLPQVMCVRRGLPTFAAWPQT